MLSKNRWILLLILSLFSFFTGCGDMSYGRAKGGNIVFEEQTFFRQLEGCYVDTFSCAVVEAAFPLAVEGPVQVCEKINEAILFHLRFSLAFFSATLEEIPGEFDAIAEQFFTEYRNMQSYQSDYFIPWKVATTSKVLFQSAKVISIQLDNYAFAGGAHPNTNTTILNFDAATGDQLRINDLIKDQEALEKIVEATFRQLHDVEPGSPVKRSEFFWGEPFHLPDNFAVLENGLYFFYNPYEVAAYAAGPTDFTIPYQQLEGIVEKKRIF